jgi:hypothetical protein
MDFVMICQASPKQETLDALTKNVVPVLSPLIAALAVLLGLRQEFRKLRTQQLEDQKQRAHAISGEVFSTLALSGLLSAEIGLNGKPNLDTLSEVRTGFGRIIEKLRTEPEFGDYLRDRVKFVEQSDSVSRMFLLLFEARRRIAVTNPAPTDVLFTHFALLTLGYLYETKTQRERSDIYGALQEICKASPQQYGLFLVDKSTPSFRR